MLTKQLSDAELALIHVNQAIQTMTAELMRMHVAGVAASNTLVQVGDMGSKLQHGHFVVESAIGRWGHGYDGDATSERLMMPREGLRGRDGRPGRDGGPGGRGGDGGVGGAGGPGGAAYNGQGLLFAPPMGHDGTGLGLEKDVSGLPPPVLAPVKGWTQQGGWPIMYNPNKPFPGHDIGPNPLEKIPLGFGTAQEAMAAQQRKLDRLLPPGTMPAGTSLKSPTDDAEERRIRQKSERFYDTAMRQGLMWGGTALDAASPDMSATLAGSFKLLAATIGQTLIPAAMSLSRGIQSTAKGFEKLPQQVKDNVGSFLGLGLGVLGARAGLTAVGAGGAVSSFDGWLGGAMKGKLAGIAAGGIAGGLASQFLSGGGTLGYAGNTAAGAVFGGMLQSKSGLARAGGVAGLIVQGAIAGSDALTDNSTESLKAFNLRERKSYADRGWIQEFFDKRRGVGFGGDIEGENPLDAKRRKALELADSVEERHKLYNKFLKEDKLKVAEYRNLRNNKLGLTDEQGNQTWGIYAPFRHAYNWTFGWGEDSSETYQKRIEWRNRRSAYLEENMKSLESSGSKNIIKTRADLEKTETKDFLEKHAPMLMHLENRTQPGYFSPDELYRKIQLEAIGKSPLQEEIERLQLQMLEKMLAEDAKGNSLLERILREKGIVLD